jgi:hypothetical protein
VTYTTHGHYIMGTPIIPGDEPEKTKNCGGPIVCEECSNEATIAMRALRALRYLQGKEDDGEDYYDEETLVKVYRALVNSGASDRQAVEAISEMQNEGILFRERRK